MTEEKKKPDIWTPPEQLDANTTRMAWLLFLEWWKSCLTSKGTDPVITAAVVEKRYQDCLASAKIVRRLEQG